MSDRVLFVDDDTKLLDACRRNFRQRFDLDTAAGGAEGIKQLECCGPYSVVVSDMRMPKMDGVEFLTRAQVIAPETVRMMLTGNTDLDTAMRAVNDGNVFRFVQKPCPASDLAKFIEAGIRQYRLITAERDLLENTLRGAVKVCTDILATTDPRSHGLALRMRELAREIGPPLGIQDLWELEVATMLHKIGGATIPPVVVMRHREGRVLSGVENDMLARVPEVGYELLANIPRLETVASMIRYSTKNFDGSGLPRDPIAGTQISLGARILRILNDLVELEAAGESRGPALAKLRLHAGRYDPDLFAKVEALAVPRESLPVGSFETTFRNVRVGDVLAADVTTVEGVLLVQAGTVMSLAVIQKLRNFATLEEVREPVAIHRATVASTTLVG